ncbi:MAG: alpha-amylase family glycosyl hydrolase [candidate division WOR-3 bacterium]|nr:alpha-amylase family glycosyl hydrolase [candidate division WOR-3 bacterium]
MFEFHIQKKCRDRYQFDISLYQSSGNVILANISAVKKFVDKWNTHRRKSGSKLISPAELNVMGLIDEILHIVIEKYQAEKNPDAFKKALKFLNQKIGAKKVSAVIRKFLELFPPRDVYTGKITTEAYLRGKTKGVPNILIVLQEILMLSLANENPAFAEFKELFDDEDLKNYTGYETMIQKIEDFFKTQPVYGPYGQTLIELLRAPMRASPTSLIGQLMYIKEHWKMLLSGELLEDLTMRIIVSFDFVKEEKKERLHGPGPVLILEFKSGSETYAELHADEPRFSPDTDWMPKVVMIAKHTYVWLYQLSKKYNREIKRLDEIPDEELKSLSEWGFNALWLIGIWERSKASMKIKKLCGNPEAIASAYSIYDYVVAQDLGGESAFNELKQRALNYNIRIAVDMVPNHTAIDSRWMKEHPDWFIQRDTPPFFNYRFSGPNLSEDPDFEIYIEDGYYDRTDAAVVFKFVERKTGRVRYIYHGNDGTSTPWNDTAQLNFLLSEVREAVIQKIIEIARKSPIIRLDAAMTLTKRHYHRLWFPEPGKGGDIPSRVEYSMTSAQFNKLFPKEFWREVVDRIAVEAPDTLLLAEAFWLMEGYFVRNLGMHRVYNSAFMNMLKMEQNREYHQVLKNILDYNPEILRRLVNFMTNPDELTAVQQFGKDDKYFGVCIMMSTMPGLCMFGHGQIEGFQEKYGMEYRRSYWDEKPDEYLIKRHEKEIFPLLKKRHLFSGVANFNLYDFYDEKGHIDDNVYAYSNGDAYERILVVYNNRYQETRGWIKGSERFHTKSLCAGLNLRCQMGLYYLCRDNRDNLFYLIDPLSIERNGWQLSLGAYKYHVFMDFKEMYDNQNQDLKRLYEFSGGQGFLNIEWALSGMTMSQRIESQRNFLIIPPESPLWFYIENIIKKTEELKNMIFYTPIAEIIKKGYAIFQDKSELFRFFQHPQVKDFIFVHTYEDTTWFNKERLELLLALLFADYISLELEKKQSIQPDRYNFLLKRIDQILKSSVESGYQFPKFIEYLTAIDY